ncbi:hypothetical protein [Halobacillus mangrovi]|nr:hypothetical protein [Halobacillus mangrovi]
MPTESEPFSHPPSLTLKVSKLSLLDKDAYTEKKIAQNRFCGLSDLI